MCKTNVEIECEHTRSDLRDSMVTPGKERWPHETMTCALLMFGFLLRSWRGVLGVLSDGNDMKARLPERSLDM